MVKPDLIIRTHRRSLSLTITKDGSLVVHAPKRLDMNDIVRYIVEKEKWITTKQKEIRDRLSINKEIIDINKILFMGKKYSISRYKGIRKIELSDNELVIPVSLDRDQEILKIKKWYNSIAKEILFNRIEYLANIMQIDYAGVTLTNSKTRWGSCDINRNIKLNFRLVMLPHKIIDFVIIHELSHIIEFNHSKQFYKIISTMLPGYKMQQKALKEYDYVLQLFR